MSRQYRIPNSDKTVELHDTCADEAESERRRYVYHRGHRRYKLPTSSDVCWWCDKPLNPLRINWRAAINGT